LRDRHPRPENNPCRTEIDHLQSKSTVKAWVNRGCCEMDQQPDSGSAALPFNSCCETCFGVVGVFDG
jgi:hypothetical protein